MKKKLTPATDVTGENLAEIYQPHKTPLQAIRAKCLDCSNYQPKEVRLCTIPDCALWPYRMGKRPRPGQTESK